MSVRAFYDKTRARVSYTFGLRSQGLVNWQDIQFHFAAPYKEFQKAKTRGVENRICRFARAVLQAGGSGIDVGANYGFVTLVMANSLVAPNRMLSFEVDPQIARVLQRTIERNRLEEHCMLINKGAAASTGAGMITVDDAVQEHDLAGIAFIKIDTDGSDYDVLQGAAQTLQAEHPVVVVEMTRHQLEIYRFLQGFGYTHFIDQDNLPVLPGQPCANLIASVTPVAIPSRT